MTVVFLFPLVAFLDRILKSKYFSTRYTEVLRGIPHVKEGSICTHIGCREFS